MAKFTTANGNTTVTFDYTAPTDKVVLVVGDCSHYLFDKGYGDHGTQEEPIEFEDLTNQQKLDIVSKHLKNVIMDAAKTYASVKAQDDAREQAVVDATNNYDLG